MLELRPATLEDAEMIATIHILARRGAMPYLPDLHTDAETRDWVANVVLAHQHVWVAEVEGNIVGYSALNGSMLNNLYVLPAAQGRGVGSTLLAHAQQTSPGEVTLYTFQRNEKSRRFYEHRGFRAVEFGDGSGNEEGEPDVRYHWSPADR
jgi:GNAT superfamily N-acetyltransferase